MPDPAVFPVIVLAVAGKKTQHQAPDRIRLPLNKQMEMIRHQAISVEKKA
jgi:hypothetical protein